MMVLVCVALFGIELGFLGQFSKCDGAAPQRLRELLSQQLFMLALCLQRDRVAPSPAFLPMMPALRIRIANPPDPRTPESAPLRLLSSAHPSLKSTRSSKDFQRLLYFQIWADKR